MDERLEKALDFANYRATLANQKRNIISRMKVLQKIHYNNGSFEADKETISFVKCLVDLGKTSAILLDTKDNAIEIENLNDLLETLVSAYIDSMTEYKIQIDKVNKARNIKKIMDW
jgi:hypothetical protein